MRIEPTPFLICLLILSVSPVYSLGGSAAAAGLVVSVICCMWNMLPPGSSVTVTLGDVSKMVVKAIEINRVSEEILTGPPYPLTFSHAPKNNLIGSFQANHLT
jgi:hypothetical protein